MSKLKTGIYAGAFDPIHNGHVALALSARRILGLNEVFFMVEESPWKDKAPIELHHRMTMVNLAIEGLTGISQFARLDKRFSIESTLPVIESRLPDDELYFIFGADVFMNMNRSKWPGLNSLLEHYIVVFERKGVSEVDIAAHAKSLGIVVAVLPSEHPNHSSTDVRLSPHDKSAWVPSVVTDYINENNLY